MYHEVLAVAQPSVSLRGVPWCALGWHTLAALHPSGRDSQRPLKPFLLFVVVVVLFWQRL